MNARLMATSVLLLVAAAQTAQAAPDDKPDKPKNAKEALQAFNDLIGGWKGVGAPETMKDKFWKETVRWGWRFKGDDVWLTVEFLNGKHFSRGTLHYLLAKDRYVLKVIPADSKDDTAVTFEGALNKRSLVLDRLDEEKKENQRIVFDMVGDIRMAYRYETKPTSRTLYTKQFTVGATKEGESLGGTGEKKPECVVSGGLGTSTINYKGATYYFCCSGCREAFNDNPEKYIKEYLEKKAKEKK